MSAGAGVNQTTGTEVGAGVNQTAGTEVEQNGQQDVDQEIRYLTAWKYTNFGIQGRYREGILWHDTSSTSVMWQIHDDTTDWHGSFTQSETQISVVFDAFADQREGGRPRPKISCLFRTTLPELWVGHDYRFRMVQMQPICKYKKMPRDEGWTIHAEWTQTTGWFYHEGPMAPAA